jgi:hypothetical protein
MRCDPRICLEGVTKPRRGRVGLFGASVEIRTEFLQKTCPMLNINGWVFVLCVGTDNCFLTAVQLLQQFVSFVQGRRRAMIQQRETR